MEPITIKNGWKRVVVSLWLSGDSVRYVARNQHQTGRTFKWLRLRFCMFGITTRRRTQ